MNSESHPLPSRFFRNETVFRGMRGSSVNHMIGCGFMLKPGTTGQHHRSVFSHYSGVLVLRGHGVYTDWNGREHRTYPGCFFQRLPGRVHSTTHPPEADWAECFVNLGEPLVRALAEVGSFDLDRPVLNPGVSLPLVERFDRLVADLRAAPESELPRLLLRIQELVVDLYALDRQAAQPDPAARIVETVAQALSQDLAGRVSLPRLARDLGVGYERLRKLFRERTGLAPGEYRIRRRLEQACSMLAQGDLSVKEVASALGYANPFVFSRQFRNVLGIPPSRLTRMR
jgi:AraC-like DNA-binding protein